MVVVDFEQFGKARLADIQTYKDNFFAQQRETHGQVGSHEGLTLTRSRGGEHQHIFTRLQHKLHIGTHGAEYFLHLVVRVLMHHNVGTSFGLIAGHRDVGNDGQTGQCSHIIVTLNAVTEEIDEVEDAGRNTDAQDKGDEHDERPLGAHLACILRHFNQLTLVGCSCQRNRVFLTLLQQHQVQARLHLLLATDECQYAFLFRHLGHFGVVLSQLTVDGMALNLDVLASLLQGLLDAQLHVVELGGQLHDNGAILRSGAQQTVTLKRNLVVFVDERCRSLVLQSHV